MKSPHTYNGLTVTIDKKRNACMNHFDEVWRKMGEVKFVAITQVSMKQTLMSGWTMPLLTGLKYKAICVYIRAGGKNILAFRGSLQQAKAEARRISRFLGVKLHDLVPRDHEGKIEDHHSPFEELIPFMGIMLTILMIVFLMILYS